MTAFSIKNKPADGSLNAWLPDGFRLIPESMERPSSSGENRRVPTLITHNYSRWLAPVAGLAVGILALMIFSAPWRKEPLPRERLVRAEDNFPDYLPAMISQWLRTLEINFRSQSLAEHAEFLRSHGGFFPDTLPGQLASLQTIGSSVIRRPDQILSLIAFHEGDNAIFLFMTPTDSFPDHPAPTVPLLETFGPTSTLFWTQDQHFFVLSGKVDPIKLSDLFNSNDNPHLFR